MALYRDVQPKVRYGLGDPDPGLFRSVRMRPIFGLTGLGAAAIIDCTGVDTSGSPFHDRMYDTPENRTVAARLQAQFSASCSFPSASASAATAAAQAPAPAGATFGPAAAVTPGPSIPAPTAPVGGIDWAAMAAGYAGGAPQPPAPSVAQPPAPAPLATTPGGSPDTQAPAPGYQYGYTGPNYTYPSESPAYLPFATPGGGDMYSQPMYAPPNPIGDTSNYQPIGTAQAVVGPGSRLMAATAPGGGGLLLNPAQWPWWVWLAAGGALYLAITTKRRTRR